MVDKEWGGNFYIDIGDVIAAAKAQHLHQLLKYDIVPGGEGCGVVECNLCNAAADDKDLEIIEEIFLKETETWLGSNDTYKQKLVFPVGFISHKFELEDIDESEDVSCKFLDKLNRGRLHIPTLNSLLLTQCTAFI